MKLFTIPATVSIIAALLLTSCDSSSTTEPTSDLGVLEFHMTVWNAYEGRLSDVGESSSALRNTYTCDIIDTRNVLYSLYVSTDPIIEGEVDDLDWILIYENDEEMLATERVFEPFELPPGDYQSIKLNQRNRMYWVCLLNEEVIEFPSLGAEDLPDDAVLTNNFGPEGLYEVNNEGVFEMVTPNERLGTFEIREGRITRVTMRMNLQTLDWVDVDGSGDWSEGDYLENWTVPEGITTMMDFIVEYE